VVNPETWEVLYREAVDRRGVSFKGKTIMAMS
jgi:hypothetical protein